MPMFHGSCLHHTMHGSDHLPHMSVMNAIKFGNRATLINGWEYCGCCRLHIVHSLFIYRAAMSYCDIPWLIGLLIDYAKLMTTHILLYLAYEHMVFGVKQLQRKKWVDNECECMNRRYTTPNGWMLFIRARQPSMNIWLNISN
jgi:hypothetical protein